MQEPCRLFSKRTLPFQLSEGKLWCLSQNCYQNNINKWIGDNTYYSDQSSELIGNKIFNSRAGQPTQFSDWQQCVQEFCIQGETASITNRGIATCISYRSHCYQFLSLGFLTKKQPNHARHQMGSRQASFVFNVEPSPSLTWWRCRRVADLSPFYDNSSRILQLPLDRWHIHHQGPLP